MNIYDIVSSGSIFPILNQVKSERVLLNIVHFIHRDSKSGFHQWLIIVCDQENNQHINFFFVWQRAILALQSFWCIKIKKEAVSITMTTKNMQRSKGLT